ncbi:DUF5605 domain-containing protein [Streptomyces pathocidini]|uniref:DUF5605 domain-containing protein n=1 Tax=Streptomyces pathocidini TaxID=1650571 RepID=UPI0033F32902
MAGEPSPAVERWGVLELELPGPARDVVFSSEDGRCFASSSFHDGRGRHLLRFMPDAEGEWTYEGPRGMAGGFVCVAAGEGNHGPVRLDDGDLDAGGLDDGGLDFRYADGTPYRPYGTTVGEVDEATVAALASTPFNRVRLRAPEGKGLEAFEQRLAELRDLGTEAEVRLTRGHDIPSVVSRLAAYRNVWWCAPEGAERDPDVLAEIREHDYGHHLLTVHGGAKTDFGAPWITHASVRHDEVRAVGVLTDQLCKPILIDACGAEGDAPTPEGSLPAREMVARIWEGVCQGGHVTHAESYGPRPWSACGGRPTGESVPRLAFLREILDVAPQRPRHNPAYYDASTIEVPGAYLLQYLGPHRYPSRRFTVPGGPYEVDVIDTWNMKVNRLSGEWADTFEVPLPAEQYMAIRISRA